MIFGGIYASEALLHPPRRPLDPRAAAEAHRIAESLRATLDDLDIQAVDGVRLRGWRFTPLGRNGSAVILLHGQADNRAGVLGFVRMFLERGYEVLAPDMRAHG